MAHQQDAGAVDVPVTHTVDSAAAALSSVFRSADEPEERGETDGASDDADQNVNDEFADDDFAEDGEESEGEEGEQDGEPEEPAIDAPASLNAEEKAVFAQLPKEAQEAWSASETRRNKQVQEATTKASQAQREHEARAAAADAEAKRIYAAQLNQFVAAFEPQRPDPQLAAQDPQRYIAAQAQYEAQKAQHDQLVQQISAFDAEATEEERKAFVQQRDRELMAIPEIANEETRKEYLDGAFAIAAELGYDQAELAEGMTARDIKALAVAREWKAKAEKYDAAMSRRMKRVRAGKNRTLKPGAAQPEGSGNRAYTQAKQRLEKTGSVDDAAAAFKAILS